MITTVKGLSEWRFPIKRFLGVALIVLAFTSNALDSRAQSNSSVTISVDSNKPIWESVRKVLNDKGYSYSQVNDNRMVTDYIKWDNALVSNRGKIQISLDGNNLKVEMVERQFAANNQWVDALGEMSKKNQEKYLVPLSRQIYDVLNTCKAAEVADEAGQTTICSRELCMDIEEVKIIGENLLIKGKMVSKRGDFELKIATHNLSFIDDEGGQNRMLNTLIGGKSSGGVIYYNFIESVPVKYTFTFAVNNRSIEQINLLDLKGDILYPNNKSDNVLFRIKGLSIPMNPNPLLKDDKIVEIQDGVYMRMLGFEKYEDNFRLKMEFINQNKDTKTVNCSVHNSRVLDSNGSEFKIENFRMGDYESSAAFYYDLPSGVGVKGYIDIANSKSISSISALELKMGTTIRVRNVKF